jgi:rubrerythrin
MRSLRDVLLEAASRPGVSQASRRSVFALAAAAPLAFGLEEALGQGATERQRTADQRRKNQRRQNQRRNQNRRDKCPDTGKNTQADIAVLNYALTLEHLEYAFYRDGLGAGGFTKHDFKGYLDPNLYARLLDIRNHEGAHVDALIATIRGLGGDPVEELCYDFGYDTAREFLGVAQALENTGVSAYDGAIADITDPALQTTGATIATVEARHAAYLNLINRTNPFPAAFDTPLPMDEVLAIAGPFIVACSSAG